MKSQRKIEECENNLIAAIIKSALDDLHSKDLKIPKNAKSEYLRIRREKAYYNKGTAKLFFKESRLFKLTGLDFDYLDKRYKKEKRDKDVKR